MWLIINGWMRDNRLASTTNTGDWPSSINIIKNTGGYIFGYILDPVMAIMAKLDDDDDDIVSASLSCKSMSTMMI